MEEKHGNTTFGIVFDFIDIQSKKKLLIKNFLHMLFVKNSVR